MRRRKISFILRYEVLAGECALNPVVFNLNHTTIMGLFWNLIQQGQLGRQESKVNTLEGRVARLEIELRKTQDLLIETLKVLEEVTGKDHDGDGRIGR